MNMNTSKKQEGYVVIVVAALLAALTSFLALAVDIGVLYSARTSAQEVADAAALAGAFTFSPYYPDSPQPQTASNHALRVALNNSVLGQPITAADVNVNVNVANRRVTVDVQSTQNTYFARALGLQTENIAVEGVAEGVGEDEGAGHEGGAEHHRQDGEQQPHLVRGQVAQRDLAHGGGGAGRCGGRPAGIAGPGQGGGRAAHLRPARGSSCGPEPSRR